MPTSVGKRGRWVAERPHRMEEETPIPVRARSSAGPRDAGLLPVICAVEQLHELVAVVGSRSGEVLWLSDGLAELCGARSFGKQHWLEALARPGSDALRTRLARTGRLSNERVHLCGRAGRELAARVSAARVTTETSCDASLVIFRLDDREEVEREFHQRVETLAAILDGSPDGVALIDRGRFIAWANPALTQMTGYPAEELLDQPLAMLLRGADLERIAGGLQHGPDAWSDVFEARRRDGRSLVVNVSLRRLTLPDGSELGAVAYVRDVTEERRIEQELARRAEELQHWVNAVSHDLRSPLVAVLGFARLLREDYGEQLDAQGLRFLRRIEEAGRTMESLVHDLLEFARIGRSEPKCTNVDPREVLLQLQAELKPRLEEAQVTLALPEEPPLLWCDRTQLYQVLSNLVGNALDHMGPAAEPAIEVEISEAGGLQELVVRDHGRGVDPADHERIFEIFQTRGSQRGGKRGTGIGLAVVRKIAEAHGGSAWVESEPGAGAEFHVTFRVA